MPAMSSAMAGSMILLMLAGMIFVMVILHRARRAPSTGHSHSMHDSMLFFVISRILKVLLRIGTPLGPMILLTVRGRKTGQPRTLPVDVFESEGRSFLVSTHGEGNSNWVRNLRAAGSGMLTRGRRRRTFSAVELSQEAAGQVLKEVLGPRMALPMRGFILRRTLAVPPDAPLDDFVRAAQFHPVFELSQFERA